MNVCIAYMCVYIHDIHVHVCVHSYYYIHGVHVLHDMPQEIDFID